MKHEGKRKAEKDLPKLNAKKGEWYNNKFCKHKQNYGVIGSFFCAFTHQALFSTKTPTIVLQQVNKNTHLELEKKTI